MSDRFIQTGRIRRLRMKEVSGAVIALIIALHVASIGSVWAGEEKGKVVQSPETESSERDPSSVAFPKEKRKTDAAKAAQQIFLYQVIFVASGSLYGHSPLGWGDPTLQSWYENISRPPEYPDGDGWLMNYIGHPIMGAHMYVFARHQGFRFYEAFGLSTAGSMVWEFAFEGPFERISTSDMLVTSTVGSLFGEGLYFLYRKIDQSKAGSKWYGKVAKLIIHPFYMF